LEQDKGVVRQGRTGVSDSETLIASQQSGRAGAIWPTAPGDSHMAISESETAGKRERADTQISDSETLELGGKAVGNFRF
ncbi:TPA: hypothetical protein ACQ3YW_005949, partial [Pseudomonas aeruginosa]